MTQGDPALDPAAPPGFVEPTFVQRLAARVVDTLLVVPVLLGVAALAGGTAGAAIALAAVAAYEVVLVSWRGQTVGKQVMGTRIVDHRSGAVPGVPRAALRWLVVIAGPVAALAVPALETVASFYPLVVLVPLLKPPLHRGLHDMAAGTVVTSVRPPAPPAPPA